MGASSDATVKEIEDIRGRLEENFMELERRMPAPAIWGKRVAGIAIGGGVSALVLRQVLKRGARKRAAKKRVEEILPAAVGAAVPVQTLIQVIPDDVAEKIAAAFEDGRWKQWVGAAAGVWLAIRLLEMRQLRRVNRALITGSSS